MNFLVQKSNGKIFSHLMPICIIGLAALMLSSITAIDSVQAQGLSQDQRRAIIQSLSDEERQKFFGMSREEKQKFFQTRTKSSGGGNKSADRPSGGRQGASGGRPSGGRGGPGGRRRGGRPPTLVELADVAREPLVQTFPITGRLVASQKSAIAARIKGSVRKILVEVGDRVKAGQVLAQLDVDRLKLEAELRSADVLAARAKWKTAQAQVGLVSQELKRLQRLRKSAAFSQARFEDKKQEVVKAKSAVDETAAALKRARAQRDLARIDLKDATIRAPYSGAILVRHVSPGAFINAGSPIVTLMDDESLEIEADVPSIRLSGVPECRVIDIQLDNNTKIKAAVRAIIPDENPLARTRAVRLAPDISGTKIKLVANQSVVLEVPQGETRNVVAIPKDAVVNRQSGKIVYVFQDGTVRPANIDIGESFGGKFEVLSGLKPGQKVVVKGNELLRPGQRVRVKRSSGRPGASRSGGPSAGRSGGRPGGQQGGRSGGNSNRRALIQSLSPEERQKFFAMSREEKQKFFQSRSKAGSGGAKAATPPQPRSGNAGGGNRGGAGGGMPREKRRAIIQSLSPEERQKFFSMSPEEKQKFFREKAGSAS